MTRWHNLEPADESIFTSAPHLYRYPIRVAVRPERVWESLTSDRNVADWGPGVRKVTWTSPRPFGVGATRDVVLALNAITVREHFFRWDEGEGYAFYATAANRPGLRRFAENYVVTADGTGALLTWTIAIEAQPAFATPVRLLSPVNRAAFGQLAGGARRYFAQHP
jgi:carbon monoxide dehydrogenase subunit G